MTIDSAIRSTVAFFDIFEHPLTDFEIRQYLPVKATLLEIRNALEKPALNLEQGNGLCALSGRLPELQSTRRRRYLASDKKIKKARRLIRLFSWLPWIRLICLANTIGTHNLRPGGDIDLFIVTKPNRLWLTKLFATSITQLAGLRPTAAHNTNRLCLSFLVDESALDLSGLRLTDDHYFPYWVAGLVPLYGDPKIYKKLITANRWLAEALPNWSTACAEPRLHFRTRSRKTDWLPFLGGLEKAAQALQKKIMSPAIKAIANLDKRVIISDHVLKLHTVDRREYFKTEHLLRLNS